MASFYRIAKKFASPIGPLVLLLAALFLFGCGSNVTLVSPNQPVSSDEIPTIEAIEFDQEAALADQGGSGGDSIPLTDGGLSSQGDTVAPPTAPTFGEIVFAEGVTDSYEPIAASFIFAKGITQIHAVFEYSGMSADNVWERVWYLNEQEISRSAGPWFDPGRGIFDYSIDNEGKPLPPGDWVLELYVDGELKSLGVFIIEE